ncbi:hypothetical protein CsSME_00040040 [Camellia sinensis var. sinensis]
MCPLINGGNEQNNIPEAENGPIMPWFYVNVDLGYAAGFSVVCTTLLFKDSWRHAYFKFLNCWNNLM